jgi:hypothetical protein
VNRFFKVDLAAEGWGLLINEGTVEQPKFRMLLKGSERWMERMAADLNSLPAEDHRSVENRLKGFGLSRHD